MKKLFISFFIFYKNKKGFSFLCRKIYYRGINFEVPAARFQGGLNFSESGRSDDYE